MAQNLLQVEAQDKTGQKSNWFTLLPAVTARDTDYKSQLQIARFSLGVMIQVVLANEVGAAGFTPRIVVPNAITGEADIVVVSFTALTANGTTLLVLHPDGADMGTEDKVGTLPREWKFEMAYTTGTPATDLFDIQAYARYI